MGNFHCMFAMHIYCIPFSGAKKDVELYMYPILILVGLLLLMLRKQS